MRKKGQFQINFFIGLTLLMVGILAISFLGLGWIMRNPNLIWVGSIVLGVISVVSAILEKVIK